MINPHDNCYIPSEGYKYLSDGTTWTDSVFLGKNHDIGRWHDTNEEPPEPEPEHTVEDKAEAYDILMGVVE